MKTSCKLNTHILSPDKIDMLNILAEMQQCYHSFGVHLTNIM